MERRDLVDEPAAICDVVYAACKLGLEGYTLNGRRPTGRHLLRLLCTRWRNGNEKHVTMAYTAGEFQRRMAAKGE